MKTAVEEVILPAWAKAANRIDPNASSIWNETIGKVVDMTIKAE